LPTTYCYSGLLLRELATVGIKVMHSFLPTDPKEKDQDPMLQTEFEEEDEELENLIMEYDANLNVKEGIDMQE
jgi:hypothetical protein